jgi:hypothetical protein
MAVKTGYKITLLRSPAQCSVMESNWRWGGSLHQTYVTQHLRTAANSYGKVRNPTPAARNHISSHLLLESAKCLRSAASSIPVCGIEPASAMGQGKRTGRAILGRRAELAVCRFASRQRIRSTTWSWCGPRQINRQSSPLKTGSVNAQTLLG